jgi:hypothetical protein
MIFSLHNKWTIIFTPFQSVLIIPVSLLLSYPYQSTPIIWYGLLIINLIIGVSQEISLLVLKSARVYYITGMVLALTITIPLLYTTLIIIKSNFPDAYLLILSTLLLLMIIEWFLSYFYQKIKLDKALEQKIPNNAINIDEGTLNLQTWFLFSRKDADKSRIQRILGVGTIFIIFAPVIGSMIYRITTPEQQSMYYLVFLSLLAMILVFGSGVKAGTATVIKEIEERRKMRFVIKKLV